jgi:aquaporin NIP
MKKYIAELIGTFILIFVGLGSIVVDQHTPGNIGLIGIAICWGVGVTAMIYTFGNVSGAHLNPAVTLTFWMLKLLKGKDVIPYILCQAVGAFAATLALKYLFPADIFLGETERTLGETNPTGHPMRSFFLEIIISFILMTVILFTSQGAKETGILAGLAIGGTILLLVVFAGPISGTSLNPTRSLAPALVTGNSENLWIYLTAPFIGMFTAGITWRLMKEK